MKTLRVQLPEKQAQKVREEAMRRYGYGKGSISKALSDALDAWLQHAKPGKAKRSFKELLGRASRVKGSSVAVQHRAKNYW